MISFPQAGVSTEFAYRYQQQESADVTVVKKQAEGQQGITVSASYSSSVSISGKLERSLAFAPKGAEQYAAVGGTEAAAVAEPAPEKTQAAQNILSFITQRLKLDLAEGATEEELASRLQAGYEGFLQGFGEAFEQLSGAGLLAPEVEAAIMQTKEDVLAGIDALAEELGVASPVDPELRQSDESVDDESAPAVQTINSQPEAPVKTPQAQFADFANDAVGVGKNFASLLEASTLDYASLAKRDFSFTLKTQDGDSVTITASATQGDRLSYQNVNYGDAYANYSGSRVQGQSAQSSQFAISVQGELDEDELGAINDLLSQVGDLSETFFSGNVEEAFEMALEIGFDESEIARFTLDLKQEVTTYVEATYAKIQDTQEKPAVGLGAQGKGNAYGLAGQQGNSSVARLMSFVNMLKDLADKADSLGVERSVIPDFAAQLAEASQKDPQAGDKVKGVVSSLLDRL